MTTPKQALEFYADPKNWKGGSILDMGMGLTEDDIAFLKLLQRCSDGFDVTPPRIPKWVKSTATKLLASGHLAGKRKSLTISESGRAVLAQESHQ